MPIDIIQFLAALFLIGLLSAGLLILVFLLYLVALACLKNMRGFD